jgi:hypothetical protein
MFLSPIFILLKNRFDFQRFFISFHRIHKQNF